jgi:MSHA biogenesis protein MshL
MKKHVIKKLSILVLLSFVSSCQTTGLDTEDDGTTTHQTTNAISKALIQASKDNFAADSISESEMLDEILPSANVSLSPQLESRFDVSVKDVPAEQFFFGLIDDSPYNIVLTPGVKGDISLTLRNVTLQQVMDIVRDVYGYEYKFKNGIYTVLPVALRTEIFPLDYINLKRTGSSSISVSAGQVNNSSGSSARGVGGQSVNNQGSSSGGQRQGQQATGTKIETRSDADFWTELEATLKILVADNEGSQIKVSPQAGVIIARAQPQALRMVRNYLNISEESLSRQVILEAKILEVKLNNSHQAGVDWNSFGSVNGDNVLNLSQTGQAISPSNVNDPLQGVFSLLYQKDDFNAVIELLNTQGDVQVLSSPRVSTINNQKAVIKVGSDEFFVTDISTTTVAGAASSTVTPDVTLTPFFSGIALDVTPQISDSGEIILHVHPTVSEVQDQTKVINLGDSEFTLPLALSTIRESDSIIKARSKQVVVIGGLMQETEISTDNSTPFISDVPLLGNLFKQTESKRVKSELIILLRAQVVEVNTWQKEIESAKKRFDALNQQ